MKIYCNFDNFYFKVEVYCKSKILLSLLPYAKNKKNR